MSRLDYVKVTGLKYKTFEKVEGEIDTANPEQF